ncbi:hypothetical protein R3P38DRAFT_2837606 [Favolaschia claudopus]|uniref:F-box domain-containing protein n=1 Tax=Favolaschia claudopus TaxID=2862362 RepID=A0AAW0E3B9_9AGAR
MSEIRITGTKRTPRPQAQEAASSALTSFQHLSAQAFQPWKCIPPELAREIVEHLADDVSSLRALCLASSITRSFALEQLFSVVNFRSRDDIGRWLDILEWTPALEKVVKNIGLSFDALPSLNIDESPSDTSVLARALSALRNVRVLKLDLASDPDCDATQARAHISLFSHLEELHLTSSYLTDTDTLTSLLTSFTNLRVLSFDSIALDDPHSEGDPSDIDLTSLQEVRISSSYSKHYDGDSCLGRLIGYSPPTALKSLKFETFSYERSCCLDTMERYLSLGAPTLTKLVLDSIYHKYEDEHKEMWGRLPTFPALESLTVRITLSGEGELAINALKAPRLTALILRIVLHDKYDERFDFEDILLEVFPWCHDSPTSMASILIGKFPEFEHLKFQVCLRRASDRHFRPAARGRMERKLLKRLEETDADVTRYLSPPIQWLDERYRPAAYSNETGKPSWPPDEEIMESGSESDESLEDECDFEGDI